MNFHLQLLLLLTILIGVSKIAGHLCQRYLNQPVVFGEIFAGLLLGPTVLNILQWPVFSSSSTALHGMVNALANIGVMLLMFIAGLETDLAQLRKVGKVAIASAVSGVFLPLVLGVLTAFFFGFSFAEAIFIGVVLTATSVSISAQTLMEIKQLGSREGTVIMGAAVIDDVLGIIVLAFTMAFTLPKASMNSDAHAPLVGLVSRNIASLLHLPAGNGMLSITITVVLMAIFFLLVYLIGSRGLRRVFLFTEHMHASHMIAATALVLVFLASFLAEYVGQVAAITGAYLIGILIARTSYRQKIESEIHPFTYALFVPIFFMSIGLEANARDLSGSWVFVGMIILVAILTKILGCGLGARFSGFTNVESIRVGIGMISRGEVGLIIAQIGIAAGIIDSAVYAGMVLMVLVTTVITPILLRLSFPHLPEVQTEVYESVVGIEQDNEQR
ncbi:MAG TPA: cation:proton antiporter [Armatimonadota bacterium]|nr:cation:proton antiporter [Armatimonadota bacterium]